jgi:hypothetical protein
VIAPQRPPKLGMSGTQQQSLGSPCRAQGRPRSNRCMGGTRIALVADAFTDYYYIKEPHLANDTRKQGATIDRESNNGGAMATDSRVLAGTRPDKNKARDVGARGEHFILASWATLVAGLWLIIAPCWKYLGCWHRDRPSSTRHQTGCTSPKVVDQCEMVRTHFVR